MQQQVEEAVLLLVHINNAARRLFDLASIGSRIMNAGRTDHDRRSSVLREKARRRRRRKEKELKK